VALMADIYSNADKVYVCLGDPKHAWDASDATRIITSLAPQIDHALTKYGGFDEIPHLHGDEVDSYSLLNWAAIKEMLYAMLGHSSSNLQASSLIKPNYKLSVEDVYVEFVQKWLEANRLPYLLWCFNHKSSPPPYSGISTQVHNGIHIASWCPRWNYIPIGGSRINVEKEQGWYNSSADAGLPSAQLVLRRLTCDSVARTFETLDELPRQLGINADFRSSRTGDENQVDLPMLDRLGVYKRSNIQCPPCRERHHQASVTIT